MGEMGQHPNRQENNHTHPMDLNSLKSVVAEHKRMAGDRDGRDSKHKDRPTTEYGVNPKDTPIVPFWKLMNNNGFNILVSLALL